MSVVLDTSVIVDVLRDNPAAIAYVNGLTTAPITSQVCRIEVLRGMRSGERGPTHRLLDSLDAWAITRELADIAGEFGRRYRRSHALSVPDLVVAATAELAGLDLATTNVRHYPMFRDLRQPY